MAIKRSIIITKKAEYNQGPGKTRRILSRLHDMCLQDNCSKHTGTPKKCDHCIVKQEGIRRFGYSPEHIEFEDD